MQTSFNCYCKAEFWRKISLRNSLTFKTGSRMNFCIQNIGCTPLNIFPIQLHVEGCMKIHGFIVFIMSKITKFCIFLEVYDQSYQIRSHLICGHRLHFALAQPGDVCHIFSVLIEYLRLKQRKIIKGQKSINSWNNCSFYGRMLRKTSK